MAAVKVRKKQRTAGIAEGRMAKDYGLLLAQPISAASLLDAERKKIVISVVLDKEGNDVVLSRYEDMVWKLWPYVTTPNIRRGSQQLDWSRIPDAYRDVCKAVIFRYWRVATPGSKSPGVISLRQALNKLVIFCRYLNQSGVPSMAAIHPLHIANFVHEQKERGLAPGTLTLQFTIIETLYRFRDEHADGLTFHPWPESSAYEVAGWAGQRRRDGKTPLIPVEVAQSLFVHAEKIINGACTILDQRDAGQRSYSHDPEVTTIRDACSYLLGTLTGMRISEISSVEVGAGRTEVKNGYTFHWVKSVEHKTGAGPVEFLMPAMGHEILRVMERWSEPYRRELSIRLERWASEPGVQSAERLQDIANARANLNRLFLGKKQQITVLSNVGWYRVYLSFAKRAGVDWRLTPHQTRRLYAYTFVCHRLGNLLFLKEQFKHSSISVSQLYCANPHQDAALYDEILEETRLLKIETVTGWLHGDELLAGGAGKKIMAMRAHDFPNRAALINETADKITIRSTGHSWCLAQDEGCGGSGIYEKGRCGGCHEGVIDGQFRPFWQETYRHLNELKAEAQELGAGAISRVQRDLEQAEKVLKDLGVGIDKGDCCGKAGAN